MFFLQVAEQRQRHLRQRCAEQANDVQLYRGQIVPLRAVGEVIADLEQSRQMGVVESGGVLLRNKSHGREP